MQSKKCFGSGGIRTHALERTGALNQRLRPLGHATHLSSCATLLCTHAGEKMSFSILLSLLKNKLSFLVGLFFLM